jgi:predicted protein tyrosine phosphatase
MTDMNRMHTATNPYQDKHTYKTVLCVCSAGLLRSPTAALVLASEPFNYNTRAAGLESYALIKVDEVLLHWADEIVCMTNQQLTTLLTMTNKPVVCLDIPDNFNYRNPELMKLIRENYLYRSEIS